MFEHIAAAELSHSHRSWTTLAGMAAQSALVAAAVMAPLVSPETLPNCRTLISVFTPGSPPPPPPPGDPAPRTPTRPQKALQMEDGILRAPVAPPKEVVMIEDPPDVAPAVGGEGGVPGGVEGGVKGGVPGALPIAVARAALPPPPVAVKPAPANPAPAVPAAPAEPPRIRVGGQVQEALLIHRVIPVYPRLAIQARVSGDVELLGIIATDGRIKELRVVRGHPLLIGAALDAVRQWVYRPTHLNREPVEVVAPITVHFTLQ